MSIERSSSAAMDLSAILIFMAVVNYGVYQVTWVYAGPITAISSLILATLLLKRRGIRWHDLGLRMPAKPWLIPIQAALVFTATGVALYLSYQVVGLYFEPRPERISRFGDMEGNLLLYLWWVLLGWIVGGFCEEMLFRGFIISRFEVMLGLNKLSTILAVIFQAAVFGLVHFYYQGAFGALTIFAAATAIGFCYILFGRNLWPVILSHGVLDTLGFLGDYLGDKAI
jgi:membrane protease YdiL (CAAX protease family)